MPQGLLVDFIFKTNTSSAAEFRTSLLQPSVRLLPPEPLPLSLSAAHAFVRRPPGPSRASLSLTIAFSLRTRAHFMTCGSTPVSCAVTRAVRQVRSVFKEYRHPLSKIFEHYAALDNVRSFVPIRFSRADADAATIIRTPNTIVHSLHDYAYP